MVDVQTIGVLVTAVSVSVAAIYYAFTLRINMKNQELSLKALEQSAKAQELSLKTQELTLKAQQQNLETRQAQLLMQIFDKYNNKDFQVDFMETLWSWKFDGYEEYITKYGSEPEKLSRLTHVWETMQGIGALLENRLVDPKMVYRVFQWGPILYWEKYGPMMKEWGRRTGEPKMYPGFEFLYDELSKLYEEEHGYRYGHRLRSMDDALASVAGDKPRSP